ncbi:MAG: hypothetical protein MSC31_14950 [Solirubrobacteraceae bacterium MAG38_C4-C5]|nr:hypothetical protein [Candidatus Siliceabacter maunaloa]
MLNELVATEDLAEDILRTWLALIGSEHIPHCRIQARDIRALLGLARVEENRPVVIAASGQLTASQRAEHNHARVARTWRVGQLSANVLEL